MTSYNEACWTRSVSRLVQDVAGRRPNDLALAEAGQALTYGQLDDRSTRLAARLRTIGVGPDVLVGLCIPSCTRVISSVSSALTRRLMRQLRCRAARISRRSSGSA